MQGALPAPEVTEPPSSSSLALRRSNSTGDLAKESTELCPNCDLKMHRAHTFRGTCKGFPASTYFRSKKSVADASTIPPTVTNIPVAEQSAPSASSGLTPDQFVEQQLLIQEQQRRSAAIHEMGTPTSDPQIFRPATPQLGTAMPSSFHSLGSVNSPAEYSFQHSLGAQGRQEPAAPEGAESPLL